MLVIFIDIGNIGHSKYIHKDDMISKQPNYKVRGNRSFLAYANSKNLGNFTQIAVVDAYKLNLLNAKNTVHFPLIMHLQQCNIVDVLGIRFH